MVWVFRQRADKTTNLTLVLKATVHGPADNKAVPSTTKLIYRLTSTTEATGLTETHIKYPSKRH